MSSSPQSLPESPTPSPAQSAQGPLVLKIRGIGNLTSFKNRRRAVRRGNSLGLIIEPKVKARQEALKRAILCALQAVSATGGVETLTASPQASLTLSLPQDDCWEQIPELIVTGKLVESGEEGCDITITRLPDL